MMHMTWLRLGKTLLILLAIIYPLWLHSAIASSQTGGMQLLLVLMPLLAGAGWIAFRAASRVWWPMLTLVFGALLAYLVLAEHERIGVIALSGLSHACFNLFMMWYFGHTLFGGREPLVSCLARLIHGAGHAGLASYTRHVTLAWTLYFALQVVVSASLYFFASITVWSFFINVLNLPLLALMFVGEYLYRNIAHPDHPRTSIRRSIETYIEYLAGPQQQNRS